jgi:hypothetical protein
MNACRTANKHIDSPTDKLGDFVEFTDMSRASLLIIGRIYEGRGWLHRRGTA